MSTDPEVQELRERILQGREDLGHTMEALAAKADVKARASRAVHDAVGDVRTRAHDAVGGVRTRAQGVRERASGLGDGARGKVGNAGAPARRLAGAERGTTLRPAATGTTAEAELFDSETALVDTYRRPELDRRLQAALLATAVGAVLGAVAVWLAGRRRR